MFKNSYQNGLLSIFYSCGANPLAIWDMEVKNGHIKRLTDSEVNSIVLEIVSTNVATTFITCPRNNQVLGIKLPFLVMIIKNMKRYFSFQITVLDDKNMRRRFRISNFQSTTKIKPFCTTMPIGLAQGWNQIQFNLADFTRRAYGTQFIETLRVQVHANARLRRIYFCERLYTEEELPQEYKLYLPLERKQKKTKPDKKMDPVSKTGGLVESKVSKKISMAATPAREAPGTPVEEAAPPPPEESKNDEGTSAESGAESTAPPSHADDAEDTATETTTVALVEGDEQPVEPPSEAAEGMEAPAVAEGVEEPTGEEAAEALAEEAAAPLAE